MTTTDNEDFDRACERAGATSRASIDPLNQVVYALQRAKQRLEFEAAELHEAHDYSAEFPASDAEQIGHAISFVRVLGELLMPQAQQPGAQAVAIDEILYTYDHNARPCSAGCCGGCAYREYTVSPQPPLPEGVSELIRDANRIAEAHVAVGNVLLERGVKLPRAVREEARDAIEAWNATSESYRARLAARGEKGVRS